MSLTSFIKIPEVKALFRNEFPLSKTVLQGEMKAVPITKNYSLVGTAFDYLFRFYLERENPNCVTKHWVAEDSLALLEQTIDEYGDNAPKEMTDASDKMTLYLDDAKEIHEEYLNTGKLGDDLIKSSIDLAHIDAFYRSGIFYA